MNENTDASTPEPMPDERPEPISPERLAEIRDVYADDHVVIGELLDEIDRLTEVLRAHSVVRNAAESSCRVYKATFLKVRKERDEERAEVKRLRAVEAKLRATIADEHTRLSQELETQLAETSVDGAQWQHRAETAKRELAEMRGRIGDATVEWAVHWRSMRDHYEICDTEEEAREAFDPDDPTYGVRSRIVGEWKVVDDGR